MLNSLRRLLRLKGSPMQVPASTPKPSIALHLQDRIVQRIASELPPGWEGYKIHYEHFAWQGETFEKYISSCQAVAGEVDYSPSLEVLDLLLELQVAPSGSSGEPWTYLTCEFDRSGKYKFEFFYGVPPLTAKTIESAKSGT